MNMKLHLKYVDHSIANTFPFQNYSINTLLNPPSNKSKIVSGYIMEFIKYIYTINKLLY